MELQHITEKIVTPNGEFAFQYYPFANLALNLNKFDTFAAILLSNCDESPWHRVKIRIFGEYITETSTEIDTIMPGESCDLHKKITLKLNPSKLLELTEGIGSSFTITLSIDGTDVFSNEYPTLIMAYDQWIGSVIRPDLLAAFVTPNHPLISKVIANARTALQRLTGDDAFDAYISGNVNRARCQVAAIYEAIRNEGISYITAPASFETTGQRIRLADKVLEEKLGTCVDLSLLFASCLEAVGLNPLLILTQGHCFAGAWLVKDCHTQSVSDDADFLLKCISDGISEIVAVETTYLTGTSPIDFEEACTKANAQLRNSAEFECFVDVYRTRINQVRPLPLRIRQNDGAWQIENDEASHDIAPVSVRQLDRYDLTNIDADSPQVTKYTIWERKLLDFTLRNSLLNIRSGRRVIHLLTFDIDTIEDAIADGANFSLQPYPLDDTPKPGEKGFFTSLDFMNAKACVDEGLNKKRLFTFLSEDNLHSALKHIYRTSRTALEENGANNLYLVLGLLKWYESAGSDEPRFAPLIMVPIEIGRSLGGVYTIRARDEETMLNVTLSELLRQQHDVDLSVLSQLPTDEHGVDIKKILTIVREKIRYKKGWNVIEESIIGLFSFNKFVMWNDLHTHPEQIQQQEIVASLIDGNLSMDISDTSDIDVRKIDSSSKPADFAIPIDVDSSQLEAIIASGEGKSFILHGPPGTGKSQTITNIIANALYQGKRVLFVAEKMAALVVVKERLDKIGLSPFCLELHSNKATKQHFLQQMENVLEVSHDVESTEYETMSEKVFKTRKELLAIVNAMHYKDKNGFSLYECIERYLSAAHCDRPLSLSYSTIQSMTPEKFADIIDKIKELGPLIDAIGNPAHHPLKDINIHSGFESAAQSLRELVPEALKYCDAYLEAQRKFTDLWGFMPVQSDNLALELSKMDCVLRSPIVNRHVILYADKPDRIPPLRRALASIHGAIELRSMIADTYSPAFVDLKTGELREKWNYVEDQWFIPRYFKRKDFIRQLPPSRQRIRHSDISGILNNIDDYNAKISKYKESEESLRLLFGEIDEYSSWDNMELTLNTIDTAAKYRNDEGINVPGSFLSDENMEKSADIADTMDKRKATEALDINHALLENRNNLHKSVDKLNTLMDMRINADNDIPGLLDKLKLWNDNMHLLSDWILLRMYIDGIEKLIDHDLSDCLSLENPVKQIIASFTKGFYMQKAELLINNNKHLALFKSQMLDASIEKYRSLTHKLKELSKDALYHRLASNLPVKGKRTKDMTELTQLKKCIKSRGRGKSIRSIIDQMPTLLPKLSPCMLMSPISVAQYISLDAPKFDIVIFDEASQMPTSEAVGAIARGKSLIVVGDPKQMPPTSFFSTSAVGDDESHIDDMESVIDDCIALSMPSMHLIWHYRSKHESLITFSNNQYYDGKLITFPSTDNMVSKVTLRKVDGIYDRSHSRTNTIEAEAIVAEVIHRLSDPELSKQSIGIVAFSKIQQDKIEDTLNAELAKDPMLEKRAYHGKEPIFVKNLENVQGDERDVILFSVGYGPDINGKVSMNFGPLNNTGGERRLNVAVSRARQEMMVFSSLLPDQIDERRTNALGVVGLKQFLKYAANGSDHPSTASIPTAVHYSQDHVMHSIEKMLRDAGYDFDMGVGSSKFKIDFAIKNPDEPSGYLLGILLDGPAYYSTKTMRDREIVQPTVLRLLNWNILHIWTMDVYKNPDYVKQRITDIIGNLRKKTPELTT